MSAPPAHPYTPLSAGHIRLLKLRPGHKRSRIVCKLQAANLGDDRLRYEALSYTWNGPFKIPPVEVTIDKNDRFQVSYNLCDALRRLRHKYRSRSLWIDQICINQNDNDEKAVQVQLMGEIYKKAHRVVVWLGEPEGLSVYVDMHRSSKRQEGPRITTIQKQNPKDLYFSFDESKIAWGFVNEMAEDKIHPRNCSLSRWRRMLKPHLWGLEVTLYSIELILYQAYWKRMWVVQEVVLAREALFMCGQYAIEFDRLCKAARVLQKHLDSCCTESAFPSTDDGRFAYETYRLFCSTINELLETKEAYIQGAGLLHLLRQNRFRESTLAHDRIFALLGLVDPASWGPAPPVHVKYDSPPSEIYKNTILQLIEATQSLDALCFDISITHHYHIFHKYAPKKDDLPSWAYALLPGDKEPTSLAPPSSTRLNHLHLYDASKGTVPRVVLRGEGVLVVEGVTCDKVEYLELGSIPEGSYEYTNYLPLVPSDEVHAKVPVIQHIKEKMFQEFYPKADKGQHYVVGKEDLSQAFWRTLFADVVACDPPGHKTTTEDGPGGKVDYRRLKVSDLDEYGEISRTSVDEATIKHQTTASVLRDAQIRNLYNAFTADRRFFMTRTGMMGFGPRGMGHGNLIVILYGGSTPFVLDKRTPHEDFTGCEGVKDFYRIVGDCYLHGIMDGQFLDLGKEMGLERTFHLI